MSIERNIAKIILNQTKGGLSGVKEAVSNLYTILEERKLLHLLPAVVREIKNSTRSRLEEEKLVVHAPRKENVKKAEIIKKVGAASDQVLIFEDESLIAGAKIKFNGKEFDTSVKGQISRLYRTLIS